MTQGRWGKDAGWRRGGGRALSGNPTRETSSGRHTRRRPGTVRPPVRDLADARRPHDVGRRRPRAVPPGAAPARGARGHAELGLPRGRLGPADAHRDFRRHDDLRHHGRGREGGRPGPEDPPHAVGHRPGHRGAVRRRRTRTAAVGALRRDRLLSARPAPLRLPDHRRPRRPVHPTNTWSAPGWSASTPTPSRRTRPSCAAYFEKVRPELAVGAEARDVDDFLRRPPTHPLLVPARDVLWRRVSRLAYASLPPYAHELYGRAAADTGRRHPAAARHRHPAAPRSRTSSLATAAQTHRCRPCHDSAPARAPRRTNSAG